MNHGFIHQQKSCETCFQVDHPSHVSPYITSQCVVFNRALLHVLLNMSQQVKEYPCSLGVGTTSYTAVSQ